MKSNHLIFILTGLSAVIGLPFKGITPSLSAQMETLSLPNPSTSKNAGIGDPAEGNPSSQSSQDLILENYNNINPLEKDLFYDAKTIGMSTDFDKSFFEGDVVAIGGGTILNADKVEVEKKAGIVRAHGHIVLLSGKQIFTGEDMEFHWVTGDFKITKAIMVSNDPNEVAKVSNMLLGFSPAEVEFERERTQRLDAITARKAELRNTYRRLSNFGSQDARDIVDEYARLNEQEQVIKDQHNPSFMRMSVKHRKNFSKRRTFWNNTRDKGNNPAADATAYFKIIGNTLQRTNGNDYRALEAIWTPCNCADDEAPAWGFHADQIDAQMGGYVDLYHPILEVKGIPILYLPYLKMPIKGRRQSGFLMPSLSAASNNSGSVFTQPVYFDFGKNFDSTLTTDLFQQRGLRLGLETRYEMKQHSGFTLNLETMRDSVWLDERELRRGLKPLYFNKDRPYCTQTDPIALQACQNSIASQLQLPNNTWRGSQEWTGQFFLAPRVSVVTNGRLNSDHQYVEDLYLGDAYADALTPSAHAYVFSTAKVRTHIDGKELYLGGGSSMGDYVFMDQQFAGLQMPFYMLGQSRIFNLDRWGLLPVPIYGQVSVKHITISDYYQSGQQLSSSTPHLGAGQWEQGSFNLVTPLVRESIVRVDQFVDLESRDITYHYQRPYAQEGSIQSWRTGLTFNLPIDGKGVLPDFMQPEDWREEGKGKYYVHHLMNWGLTFSTRPSVRRRGDYADPSLTGQPLVYFDSDRKEYNTTNDETTVPIEDTMTQHQRITFSTTHRWKTYRRGWNWIGSGESENKENDDGGTGTKVKSKTPPPPPPTARSRAISELKASMVQPEDVNALVDEIKGKNDGTGKTKALPYKFQEYNASEPVNFGSSVTYDFIQEKKRQEQINTNNDIIALYGPHDSRIVPYQNLPQAWSGPNFDLNLNWDGYSLSNHVVYNTYLHYATTVNFLLTLPTLWKTAFKLEYDVDKQPIYNPATDTSTSKQTVVRRVSSTSDIIPHISLLASYAVENISETTGGPLYETRYGMQYFSPSGCWGVRFLRSRDFNQTENDAVYLLQLSVIFMGQQRPLDMSPQFGRHITDT